MFNHEAFARVFDDSGLTKTEIADIYGVSRQTVYAWYSGSSAPLQRTVVAKEQLYTRALITALGQTPAAAAQEPGSAQGTPAQDAAGPARFGQAERLTIGHP